MEDILLLGIRRNAKFPLEAMNVYALYRDLTAQHRVETLALMTNSKFTFDGIPG